MSPYKNFLNAAKDYFNSVPFLRFLLTAYIFVFATGGLFYLLGAFIITISPYFATIGIVLMFAGIILTIIQEDMMTLLITSGVIAIGSLIAFIKYLFSLGSFGFYVAFIGRGWFEPVFYFLAFGTIALLVLIKSEKFKQMRAASAAARAQYKPQGIACPQCGAFVPVMAGFCPQCGAKNPVQAQYAAPAQPQYAPPVQPQYTAPVPPSVPPVQPQPEPTEAPPAPSSEQAAVPKCKSCGADLAPGAAFCGQCGAKQ